MSRESAFVVLKVRMMNDGQSSGVVAVVEVEDGIEGLEDVLG